MKFLVFAFAALFTGLYASAQTTNSIFGVTTSAVGINLNGNNYAAADATGTLAVVNSPSYGEFYAEGHVITTTSGTFNATFGGLKWTPNIDDLISKTLIPAKTFQVSLHGAAGFVKNAAGRKALGGIAGVNFDYDPNSNGHFVVNVLRADYLNASGFGKSPSGYAFSSGIGFTF